MRIEEIAIRGPAAPWAALGLAVEAAATRVGAVRLRFGAGDGTGIAGWSLRGLAAGADLDGLPTVALGEGDPPDPADPAGHPLGAVRLDHVVVTTPDLERTFAALAAAGLERRRVREAGRVRQGFYRLGEVILEVAGDVPSDPGDPAGDPARFWGLVLVVADLDAAAAQLGERLGDVRRAVQPGRRIATVREAAGLGVPVALMTG